MSRGEGAAGGAGPRQASYVLPLRWDEPGPIDELASYLGSVREEVDEILVVDGSPPPSSNRTQLRSTESPPICVPTPISTSGQGR